MKKIKVGLIGCGTIGTALAKAVQTRFRSRAVLAYVCDSFPEKVKRLVKRLRVRAAPVSLDRLIRSSDLVLEAAHPSVSAHIAVRALRQNKKILVMSAGGLLRLKSLFRIARQSRGRLWVPSGAIVGVDGLAAARQGKIRRVVLKTYKPPAGLRGAPYFRRRPFPKLTSRREVCVFRGSAAQAVKAFPQNINVAAVLSLAGLGPKRTRVEIWTSRAYRTNQHEVLIEGNFGKIRTRTENVPAPGNPRTSSLAILSAQAVLEEIFSSVELGT